MNQPFLVDLKKSSANSQADIHVEVIFSTKTDLNKTEK